MITFESASSGGIDLEAIGKRITGKKIAIGVIDHHTLQVETPDRWPRKSAPRSIHSAERLVISSDCGMGREDEPPPRLYKMVSLVQAPTWCARNPTVPKPNAWPDERYSLVMPAKSAIHSSRPIPSPKLKTARGFAPPERGRPGPGAGSR